MATKADRWLPRTSFGGLVLEVAAVLRQLSARALKAAQLESMSFSRVGLLNAIEIQPATLTELSLHLGSRQPSLLELLRKLEAEKLVRSTSSPDDGRKVFWHCTPKGKRNLEKSREVLRDVGEEVDQLFLRANISPERLSELKIMLQSFLAVAKEGTRDDSTKS